MTRTRRFFLLGSSILSTCAFSFAGSAASAQEAPESGLADIIVTAQKREQNLQDVPIAVTAISQETLQANRVMSVNDLNGLAPGLTVRETAGSVGVPAFSMRGVVSYGVVPGSDKQISLYLDGVYIGSSRGSIFDLPDIERLEVLRGPQGTLFGRNATAGAVSVTTRDPSGEAHIRGSVSVGNYDSKRIRLSADTPQIGPFSAYLSGVWNYKRGDIRNAGAGQIWDRSASPSGLGANRSPKYLGTKDSLSYFAAVKFEPSDDFTMVYKYDRTQEQGTPDGAAISGINPAAGGGLLGNLLQSLIPPEFYNTSGRRPKVVSNSFAGNRDQTNSGHSLTATWQATDDISVKNILAYRKSHVFVTSSTDGISGIPFNANALVPYATFVAFSADPSLATASPDVQAATIGAYATAFAPLVGQPFVIVGSQADGGGHQWSDELQVNYDSDFVTLTAGAMWFKSKDFAGGPINMQNSLAFTPVPGGVIPLGQQGISYNRSTSIAAYVQGEFHVTPQLDILAGARITRDKKSGEFVYQTAASGLNTMTLPFSYKDTRPNYMLGVNFKPNDDMLVYGKFSTAFVSGGSTAGIPYEPETATSWEAGLKADFLDRRLRTNLAVYTVKYKNFQTAQSGANFRGLIPNAEVLPVFVYPQGGPVKAHGFELEVTGAPARMLTVGSSLAYTKTKYSNVDPILIAANGGDYQPGLRPKWTSQLWGQFESDPLFGETTLMARVDANWQSSMFLDQNRVRQIPGYLPLRKVPAYWTINSRVALRNLDISGVKAELAVWGRNLGNQKMPVFALINDAFGANATFMPARTYGLELNFDL
ncbi:MAG TPA: TonB-dependent receptor [Sphingobium sp.]|uniref:TonB-dependent receptor n=1 Tax=Sphingobium sp. TaxID=1912891 RepID=UPI002ED1664E